jgi:hypothetical protein
MLAARIMEAFFEILDVFKLNIATHFLAHGFTARAPWERDVEFRSEHGC